MKKIILASIATVLGLISLSSFAACNTSSSNFCQCYVQEFKQNCPQYMPAGWCSSRTQSSIKDAINQTGVGLSCSKQHDSSPQVCKTTTNYFLNHC